MIFPCFSHDIPMIFPLFSNDFPMIFPWFSHYFFHCFLKTPVPSVALRRRQHQLLDLRPRHRHQPRRRRRGGAGGAGGATGEGHGRKPGPELERGLRMGDPWGNFGDFFFLDFFGWNCSEGIPIRFRNVMGIWTGNRWFFFSPCDMSVLPSPPQNGDDFACKNDMIWPWGNWKFQGRSTHFNPKTWNFHQ